MREDLHIYKGDKVFRITLDDICYAWAILHTAQTKGIGELIKVPKLRRVKIRSEERYAILLTYTLVKKLLGNETSPKRYIFYTALVLVKNMQYTSCWKIKRVIKATGGAVIRNLDYYIQKFVPQELQKRIEEEVAKVVLQKQEGKVLYW